MEVRAGPGPIVNDGPRTWRLGWNNQDAKAELEAQIVAFATEDTLNRMKRLSSESAQALFTLFQNRVDAGAYHTFAPGWTHVMADPASSWLFLLSLLKEHQPGATAADAKRLLAEEPERVRIAVGIVAPDFFEAVAIQVGVEKGTPPQKVRAVAETIATAVMEKFPGETPAPATG